MGQSQWVCTNVHRIKYACVREIAVCNAVFLLTIDLSSSIPKISLIATKLRSYRQSGPNFDVYLGRLKRRRRRGQGACAPPPPNFGENISGKFRGKNSGILGQMSRKIRLLRSNVM